jgi:hypothetical protein
MEQIMEHLLAEMKDVLRTGHEEIIAKLESLVSRMGAHKAKAGVDDHNETSQERMEADQEKLEAMDLEANPE